MQKITHGRGYVYSIQYHIVWCVKYRHKVLKGKVEEKLKELQAEYPKRNLKIIGLTDLHDLFDRRQVVDIRKQKLIVRSGKFVKNNWISAVATVLLAMVFAYLYVMDFDDNPAFLSAPDGAGR